MMMMMKFDVAAGTQTTLTLTRAELAGVLSSSSSLFEIFYLDMLSSLFFTGASSSLTAIVSISKFNSTLRVVFIVTIFL